MSSGVEVRRDPTAIACLFALWAAGLALVPGTAAKAAVIAPAVFLFSAWWLLCTPTRWMAAFFAAALLLPPLPIALGDSGPHAAPVFAAVGLLAGLVWLKRWTTAPVALPDRPLLALTAVLLASVPIAALRFGWAIGAASAARVALFGIAAYVYFYTSHGPARGANAFRGMRGLYWAAMAAALIACIDFYYQLPAPAGYGPQFVWLDSGVFRRAQGLFYEASTLGNLCAFFLVMVAVAIARKEHTSPLSRGALALGALIFGAALVLSYSRASLVTVLIAAAVLLWRERRQVRLGRAMLVLFGGAGVVAYIVSKLLPQFADMYWTRLSSSAEYLFAATNGVLSGRVDTWQALAHWIAANPWDAIVGIGYKTLPYTNAAGAHLIADNMYLSTLVETGIAGLAALLWLHVAILRASNRAARSPDPARSFAGTWMFCFWAGEVVQMFSGDLLTYWRVLPVYFWVLAVAVRE